MRIHRIVALLAALCLASLQARAADDDLPPPDRTGGVDLRDAEVIAKGMEKLSTTCGGYCHGSNGSGFKAPALRNRPDLDPEGIHATVSYGRKRAGKVMPPWKGVLTETEIWSVVAAIVSLRHVGGPAPAPTSGTH